MRCLSVTPGNFDTPMGALESGQADVFKKYSALKRNGKPEEIAALFALLLDERLGFLTGADILMDGGVVVEQGSAKDLIDHPKEERTRQFLASYGK